MGRSAVATAAVSVGVALLLAPFGARHALACTPPPGGLPSYTFCERVAASDVVPLGTVVELREGPGWPDAIAVVAVEEYLKATGPMTVTIQGFGPGSLCLSQVRVGDRQIFFTRGDPYDVLQAHYLSQFDAVAAPDPTVIAAIRAGCVASPTPTGTSTPTVTPTTTSTVVARLWLPIAFTTSPSIVEHSESAGMARRLVSALQRAATLDGGGASALLQPRRR